jgi:hypothetical protein
LTRLGLLWTMSSMRRERDGHFSRPPRGSRMVLGPLPEDVSLPQRLCVESIYVDRWPTVFDPTVSDRTVFDPGVGRLRWDAPSTDR